MQQLLGYEPAELPACDESPQLTGCIALVMALNEQGREEDTRIVAERTSALITSLRDQGFESATMLLIENYLQHLDGDGDSLETAVATAIERGWRVPVPVIRWLFTGHVDDEVVERLAGTMDAALAVERERFEQLRSAPEALPTS
jgi:hypothetical protein